MSASDASDALLSPPDGCVEDSFGRHGAVRGFAQLDDFEDNMLKPQQLLNLALLVAILGKRAIAVVQH